MTRDQQAALAETTLAQGMNIRTKLLEELDDLEGAFKKVRETVEALPPDTGLTVPLPDSNREVEVKVRRKWTLWNR